MYVCNTWNKEIFKIELVGPDHSEKKKFLKKGLNNLSCKKKMKSHQIFAHLYMYSFCMLFELSFGHLGFLLSK